MTAPHRSAGAGSPDGGPLAGACRRFLNQLLRCLVAGSVVYGGCISPDWWQRRGDHWWEGYAPPEPARRRRPATPAEDGELSDPRILDGLRSLRDSQDLPALHQVEAAYDDAAPRWHPERRRVGGG